MNFGDVKNWPLIFICAKWLYNDICTLNLGRLQSNLFFNEYVFPYERVILSIGKFLLFLEYVKYIVISSLYLKSNLENLSLYFRISFCEKIERIFPEYFSECAWDTELSAVGLIYRHGNYNGSKWTYATYKIINMVISLNLSSCCKMNLSYLEK